MKLLKNLVVNEEEILAVLSDSVVIEIDDDRQNDLLLYSDKEIKQLALLTNLVANKKDSAFFENNEVVLSAHTTRSCACRTIHVKVASDNATEHSTIRFVLAKKCILEINKNIVLDNLDFFASDDKYACNIDIIEDSKKKTIRDFDKIREVERQAVKTTCLDCNYDDLKKCLIEVLELFK